VKEVKKNFARIAMATNSISDKLFSSFSPQTSASDNNFKPKTAQTQSQLQKILEGLDQYVSSNEDLFKVSNQVSYFNYTKSQSGITKIDQSSTNLENSSDKKINFEITTKQGDVVSVNLFVGKTNEDGNTEIAVDFDTEGELSEKEKEEITKTISDIGSLTDNFFGSSESISFGLLSKINSDVLSGIKISADRGINELDLSYSIDKNNEKQSLSLDMTSSLISGKFDITTGFGQSDAAEVQNYLSQIDKVTKASYQGEDAKTGKLLNSLYRDGLSTMFDLGAKLAETASNFKSTVANPLSTAQNIFSNLVQLDSRYQGLSTENKALIQEGVKNVVDFSAKFSAGDGGKVTKTHNELQEYQTGNGYSLLMEQSTKVNAAGKIDQTVKIKQETAISNFKKEEASKIDETYKISIEKFENGTKIDQNRSLNSFNYSKVNLGFGESRKKLSNLSENSSSSVLIGLGQFSEENSNSTKGIVYDALLAGNKKFYEDSKEINKKSSSKRKYLDIKI